MRIARIPARDAFHPRIVIINPNPIAVPKKASTMRFENAAQSAILSVSIAMRLIVPCFICFNSSSSSGFFTAAD